MKKNLLILIFISLIINQLSAQSSIILKFGASLSNVAISDNMKTYPAYAAASFLGDSKSKLGFAGGIALNRQISDAFSIQPELLFVQKGYKYSEEFLGDKFTANFNLYYFELPILAKYTYSNNGFLLFLNAGPSISYALGGKYKDSDGESFTLKFGDKIDPNNDVWYNNNLDLGLQMGGGFGFEIGNGNLILDARYGLGLSHLINSPPGKNQSSFKNQNRVFAFTVGYQIPLDGGGYGKKKKYKKRRR